MAASTPISESDWQNAVPGQHQIKDVHDRRWDIIENLGSKRVGHALKVQCPGHPPEVLFMSSMYRGRHIVDDGEYGILVELNCPEAALIG